MPIDDFIEVTNCSRAREFLDFLKISDPRWLPQYAVSSPWVFRGQRDSRWQLLPRAMRKETDWFDSSKQLYWGLVDDKLKKHTDIKYHPSEHVPTHKTLCELVLQSFAEQTAVREFIELANRVGHQIPDEDVARLSGELDLDSVIEEFISSGPLPRTYRTAYQETILYGLAQHHGIPTRLLDWTYSPYIAAFFAAEEAMKFAVEKRTKEEFLDDFFIVVWGINYTELDQNTDLKIVKHRRAKISYLHAQGGIFIQDSRANLYYAKNSRWRSFEEVIDGSTIAKTGILRKVVLPASESPELLRLLAVENVSRAHLMPTYDNITETLKIMKYLNIQTGF